MDIHIQNLSASDLNWLIWGSVFLLLVLSWGILRANRMLTQMQQRFLNLSIELKRLNNHMLALMNNSGININENDDFEETKLYVGNIDYSASEAELAAHFAKFGHIEMVNIPLDRYTGRTRGFGFVTFKKSEDATKAMGLDGSEFKGRQIQVNFARERAAS